MRVRDLMTVMPFSVRSDLPLLQARAWMDRRHIRHLLVVDDGRLVGILSDRDVRENLPSPTGPLSVWELTELLTRLTVGEVMTSCVIMMNADAEASEAAAIMLGERVGALPVVHGGQLVGIITPTDVVRTFLTPAARAA